MQNDSCIPFSAAVRICMKGQPHAYPTKFKKGFDFKLNENRYEIIGFIKRQKILNFNETGPFVSAIKIIYEKLENKDIKKIEDNILSINQQANAAIYLNIFEQILNKRRKNDLVFLNK